MRHPAFTARIAKAMMAVFWLSVLSMKTSKGSLSQIKNRRRDISTVDTGVCNAGRFK